MTKQHSRRALGLQFHRAPTDNDRGGYVGQWDVAGLLGPALGPFDARSSWARREADGAVVVSTEFALRPRAPKPRLCQLLYKVMHAGRLGSCGLLAFRRSSLGGKCGEA